MQGFSHMGSGSSSQWPLGPKGFWEGCCAGNCLQSLMKKADVGRVHRPPARCGRRGALQKKPAVKEEPRSSGLQSEIQKTSRRWIGTVSDRRCRRTRRE